MRRYIGQSDPELTATYSALIVVAAATVLIHIVLDAGHAAIGNPVDILLVVRVSLPLCHLFSLL